MSRSARPHAWPATYSPGRWTALAGANTWVLLQLDADHVMRPQLWQLVSGNAPLDELVSELARDGLRTTPHFAMVQREGDEAIVIVRGTARVLVDGFSDDHYEVDGAGVTTWIERRVGEVARLELVGLSEVDAAAPSLPLSSGVALAGVIRLMCRENPEGRVSVEDDAPAASEIAETAVTDSVPVTATAENLTDTLSSDATSMFTPPEDPEPEPEPEPAIATQAAVVLNPYDQLFEETQQRTVEDAAVRPAEAVAPPPVPAETLPSPLPAPPPELPPNLTPGWSAVPLEHVGPVVHRVGSPPAPTPPAATPPAPAGSASSAVPTSSAPTPSDGGLIDATPWAARHAPSTPSFPAPQQISSPAAEIEETERTVKRSAVRGVTPGPTSAAAHFGPTVQAVLCPAGHLNPAHATACRVCHQSLAVQDPVTVPRPVLGVLKLSTGDVVTLDRGVLLGRSPSAEFDGKGERPHVVRLPSPGQDISRTHAEIRIDGWHVLITDLDSTNGTMITVPGEEPRRLRPNDPTMIPPGTVVSLADEVSFEYGVSEGE